MKRMMWLLIGLLITLENVSAQFKSQTENQPSPSQALVHPAPSIGNFLGLLNPENFNMRHSLSFSYLSSGNVGLSLASYTNSMFYKISDPLNVRFDVTLQGSPFGNYGGIQQNELSRLYLSRAELNYRPSENMFIRLQFNQIPLGTYFDDGYGLLYYPYARGDR